MNKRELQRRADELRRVAAALVLAYEKGHARGQAVIELADLDVAHRLAVAALNAGDLRAITRQAEAAVGRGGLPPIEDDPGTQCRLDLAC